MEGESQVSNEHHVSGRAFYAFKAFYESFNLFQIGINSKFHYNLWLVLSVINLVANLNYALAILCIQKKLPFTIRY